MLNRHGPRKGRFDSAGSLLPNEANAYLAQTDACFGSLQDWGKAIYGLWLHNDGAAPTRQDEAHP